MKLVTVIFILLGTILFIALVITWGLKRSAQYRGDLITRLCTLLQSPQKSLNLFDELFTGFYQIKGTYHQHPVTFIYRIVQTRFAQGLHCTIQIENVDIPIKNEFLSLPNVQEVTYNNQVLNIRLSWAPNTWSYGFQSTPEEVFEQVKMVLEKFKDVSQYYSSES